MPSTPPRLKPMVSTERAAARPPATRQRAARRLVERGHEGSQARAPPLAVSTPAPEPPLASSQQSKRRPVQAAPAPVQPLEQPPAARRYSMIARPERQRPNRRYASVPTTHSRARDRKGC